MNDNTIPVKVLDKNNKLTTVHRKRDEVIISPRGASPAVIPPTLSDKDRAELTAEVSSEYDRVMGLMAKLEAEREVITKQITPLRDEMNSILDIKMELERDAVDVDSPIGDIKALNELAFFHSGAAENERGWLKKLHPMFNNSLYDIEHNLPIPGLYLTYAEPVDETLVEAMKTFATKLADGRDSVQFHVLSGNGDSANIFVEPETGKASLTGESRYFSIAEGDLYSVLTQATKRFPGSYPSELASEIFPDDGY